MLRCTSDEPVALRLDERAGRRDRGRHPDDERRRGAERRSPSRDGEHEGQPVDLTVEQGRGYLSAERNKKTSTIGVIPVDAILLARAAGVVLHRADHASSRRPTMTSSPWRSRPTVGSRHARRSRPPARRCAASSRLVAELSDEPKGLELGGISPATSASPDLELPHRGARPVGAAAQLPQAGARRHDRPAGAEDGGRPPRDHELRVEVARRGAPEARRPRSPASRVKE